MKRIHLTQGKVALVDDEDYDRLIKHSWHFDGNYAVRSVRVGDDNIKIFMHKEIVGAPREMIIDHKDRDGLNNQKSNLRPADDSQNACNRENFEGSNVRYKGVDYCKERKKYRARITKNRKLMYIGRYETKTAAAAAYNEKAKEIHGEFAVLNRIRGSSEMVTA